MQRWLIALTLSGFASAAAGQSVTPCPNAANCAQVATVSASGAKGATVQTGVQFTQGPNDSQAGQGIDEVAALAMTINLTDALSLANCTLTGDGVPAAIRLAGGLSNFNLMVENASCANGKTHCLCPDSGSTRDAFINLVVFGPNPLPAQGTGVDIPVLPSGRIIDLDLKVADNAPASIPLHIFTETRDSSKPQFTAFLSAGDKGGSDVTCVRQAAQPPCSAGSTSQVAITDGAITVTGQPAMCVGDCNGDGEVTVDEFLRMVNIALGNAVISQCPAGDRNGDNEITIDEILNAVNNALAGCPQ